MIDCFDCVVLTRFDPTGPPQPNPEGITTMTVTPLTPLAPLIPLTSLTPEGITGPVLTLLATLVVLCSRPEAVMPPHCRRGRGVHPRTIAPSSDQFLMH